MKMQTQNASPGVAEAFTVRKIINLKSQSNVSQILRCIFQCALAVQIN